MGEKIEYNKTGFWFFPSNFYPKYKRKKCLFCNKKSFILICDFEEKQKAFCEKCFLENASASLLRAFAFYNEVENFSVSDSDRFLSCDETEFFPDENLVQFSFSFSTSGQFKEMKGHAIAIGKKYGARLYHINKTYLYKGYLDFTFKFTF